MVIKMTTYTITRETARKWLDYFTNVAMDNGEIIVKPLDYSDGFMTILHVSDRLYVVVFGEVVRVEYYGSKKYSTGRRYIIG